MRRAAFLKTMAFALSATALPEIAWPKVEDRFATADDWVLDGRDWTQFEWQEHSLAQAIADNERMHG